MIFKFISHSMAKKHSIGRFHPESPQRIQAIEQWIHSQSDEKIQYEIIEKLATKEDILSVHSSNLYELVEKTQGVTGHFYFDADTAANEYTFKAACQAVEAGKKAVFESNHKKTVFALVRPPGHHATRISPGGFCIFNNIAIATELAIQKKKYHRIAIIDFDQHYGNGTAAITGSNADILYFSTHADPRLSYPGSGFIGEIGEADGKGTSIAVPLNYRASEADFFYAFDTIFNPICLQFKPELIAVSAGFDGYERDPIGILGFSKIGFELIGKVIKDLATSFSIPLAHFLEGGYNIQELPNNVASYVKPFISDDKEPLSVNSKNELRNKIQENTSHVVDRIRELLKDYWEI